MLNIAVIHSNNEIFMDSNFYRFAAQARGKSNEIKSLMENYIILKKQGPVLLKETFSTSLNGLTKEEFNKICRRFWGLHKAVGIESKFEVLKKDFFLDQIWIFSSFPQEVYAPLMEKLPYVFAFGLNPNFDENKTVKGFLPLSLSYPKEVEEKMRKFGFTQEQIETTEANRYGLIKILLDERINRKVKTVIGIGCGDSALPMRKVVEVGYDKLKDLV